MVFWTSLISSWFCCLSLSTGFGGRGNFAWPYASTSRAFPYRMLAAGCWGSHSPEFWMGSPLDLSGVNLTLEIAMAPRWIDSCSSTDPSNHFPGLRSQRLGSMTRWKSDLIIFRSHTCTYWNDPDLEPRALWASASIWMMRCRLSVYPLGEAILAARALFLCETWNRHGFFCSSCTLLYFRQFETLLLSSDSCASHNVEVHPGHPRYAFEWSHWWECCSVSSSGPSCAPGFPRIRLNCSTVKVLSQLMCFLKPSGKLGSGLDEWLRSAFEPKRGFCAKSGAPWMFHVSNEVFLDLADYLCWRQAVTTGKRPHHLVPYL